MDKVVDHILVFKGEGEIQDFPGNYTQFREWDSLQPADTNKEEKREKTPAKSYRSDEKKKMSYKEKREFETLESEIAKLETEISSLEAELCSGNLSIEELTDKSILLPKLKNELDDKSMRWLELSELG